MKVGIITIHNSPNYGACLQAFALWKYIELKGTDCEIIDLHRPVYTDYVASTHFKPYRQNDLNKSSFSKLKYNLRFWLYKFGVISPYNKIAKQKFYLFNSQIRISKSYRGIDELYANPPIYDLYVTGSDQLWNPTQGFCLEPYFLTFAPKDKRKIAYAASIGISELRDNEKQDFAKWLEHYDDVAVREKTAQDLLESITNKEIKLVADPTFLLDTSFWGELAKKPKEKEPYILLFTLSFNSTLLEYALKLSRESGIRLIYLEQKQPKIKDGSYTAVTDASPEDFLGYIAGAEMVITTSFHCTVFSLILGAKNFFSYIAPTNKRGSRITELLAKHGVADHLLPTDLSYSWEDLSSKTVNKEIVRKAMDLERQTSRSYLDKYLTDV